MIVVHLTASTFLGGPERQMLGLARHLGSSARTVFLSFAEGGRCEPFLQAARDAGHEARALSHDTPHICRAIREVRRELERLPASVLLCHGYKAGFVGRFAARRAGVPVVAVSRGWTGESFKVRLYETIDRINLRWMDRVICVSDGQARKVLRAGVKPEKIAVIRNSIDIGRFEDADLRYCRQLHEFFDTPRRAIVGSAGRLSPEKGFDVLVDAAALVAAEDRRIGFVHFGDGPNRDAVLRKARELKLGDVFAFAGHRTDLDQFIPFFDVLALPSHTEGLPNVVLEAFAASVPVVATAVGGTPEVVRDGVNGFLVPPGEPEPLARRILDVLASEDDRLRMGRRGHERVREEFTFAAQAQAYRRLLAEVIAPPAVAGTVEQHQECAAEKKPSRRRKLA